MNLSLGEAHWAPGFYLILQYRIQRTNVVIIVRGSRGKSSVLFIDN